MIRLARTDDVKQIAAMGAKFHDEAGWGDIADYDTVSIELTLSNMIANADAIVLVAEVEGELIGMAGGITAPLYFNHAHRIGQELFYWIEPGERNGVGRMLLEALEDEGRVLNCNSWVMVALDNVRPEVTGRLYRMRGYRPAERNWIRKL